MGKQKSRTKKRPTSRNPPPNTLFVYCDVCNRPVADFYLSTHKRRCHGKKFKCNFCSTKFTARMSLNRHEKLYHYDTEKTPKHKPPQNSPGSDTDEHLEVYWNCDRCNDKYPTARLLTIHQTEIHGAPFRCDTCNKSYLHQRSIKDHNCKAQLTKFNCHVCSLDFISAEQLQYHAQTCTESDFERKIETDYRRCNRCPLTFKSFQEKRLHKCAKTITKRKANELNDNVNDSNQPSTSTDVMLFWCDVCGEGAASAEELYQHKCTQPMVKIRRMDQPDVNNRGHQGKQDDCPVTAKTYDCIHCNKSFSKNKYRRWHKCDQAALTPKPYICYGCGKRFTKKKHKRNHQCAPNAFIHQREEAKLVKDQAPQVKSYECDECQRVFTKKKHKRNHQCTAIVNENVQAQQEQPKVVEDQAPQGKSKLVEDQAPQVKSYECDECQRVFTKKKHKRNHQCTAIVNENVQAQQEQPKVVEDQAPQGKSKLVEDQAPQVKSYECDECQRVFTKKKHKRNHQCTAIKNENVQGQQEVPKVVEDQAPQEKSKLVKDQAPQVKSYECDECQRVFTKKKHKRNHHCTAIENENVQGQQEVRKVVEDQAPQETLKNNHIDDAEQQEKPNDQSQL